MIGSEWPTYNILLLSMAKKNEPSASEKLEKPLNIWAVWGVKSSEQPLGSFAVTARICRVHASGEESASFINPKSIT